MVRRARLDNYFNIYLLIAQRCLNTIHIEVVGPIRILTK